MTSSPQTFTLQISSSRKNIHLVEDFFVAVNRKFRLPEEKLHALLVAVTEAVNNGIIHGNKNDESKYVTVTCAKKKNIVTVSIADDGNGFTPGDIANPLEDENLFRTSGRGVFLMKAFMQSVKYNKKGNKVTMTMIVGK